MKRRLLPVICAAIAAMTVVSCNRIPQFGKAPVRKVVAAMTLEEKVNLLVGVGAWNGNDIAQEIKDAKNLIHCLHKHGCWHHSLPTLNR